MITDICCEDQVLIFYVYYVALEVFQNVAAGGAVNTALMGVCSHFNNHLWRESEESVLWESYKDKKEVRQSGQVYNLGTYSSGSN
jgi:hypothetical protein